MRVWGVMAENAQARKGAKRGRSAKWYILVTISLVLTVCIMGAAALELRKDFATQSESLAVRAKITAQLQAAALVQPMWTFDEHQTDQLIQALKEDPAFKGVILRDGQGKTVTAQGEGIGDGKDEIQVTAPVIYKAENGSENKLGELSFALSTSSLRDELSYKLVMTAAMLVLMLLAMIVLIGKVLDSRVLGPLDQMTEAMEELADGNTDVHIPANLSVAEVSAMAHAMEIFKANKQTADALGVEHAKALEIEQERRRVIDSLIEGFDQRPRRLASDLSSVAHTLTDTARKMSTTAKDTGVQSEEVIHAAEQASMNVHSVASAAEELSSAIQQIGQMVTEAYTINRDAGGQAERTSNSVKSLSEAASKIGDVVTLITTIAAQTNLLALNATIEAARAGEAGKGFAVVAGEVKTLANQTSKATEDIRLQVSAIQDATRGVIESITGIRDTVVKLNEVNGVIASAIEEQRAATAEIARSSQEAASCANEVNRVSTAVHDAATVSVRSAQDIASDSGQLMGNVEQLIGEMEEFFGNLKSA